MLGAEEAGSFRGKSREGRACRRWSGLSNMIGHIRGLLCLFRS